MNQDKLKAIRQAPLRVLVTHANCPDGFATAMLFKHARPEIAVRFLTYGTEEWRGLRPEAGMVFCDITPQRERAPEFVDAGAWVLDHHEGAKDIVEMFGERGVYSETDSGARLAFEAVSPRDSRFAHFAALASIRDTWRKDSPFWGDACAQASYLMTLTIPQVLTHEPWLSEHEMFAGRVLDQDRQRQARRLLGNAAVGLLGGRSVILVNDTAKLASDFGEVARGHGFDLSVTWSVDNRENLVVFGLRSTDVIDCIPIAKRHGGGGHARAAGFTLPLASLVGVLGDTRRMLQLVGAEP